MGGFFSGLLKEITENLTEGLKNDIANFKSEFNGNYFQEVKENLSDGLKNDINRVKSEIDYYKNYYAIRAAERIFNAHGVSDEILQHRGDWYMNGNGDIVNVNPLSNDFYINNTDNRIRVSSYKEVGNTLDITYPILSELSSEIWFDDNSRINLKIILKESLILRVKRQKDQSNNNY